MMNQFTYWILNTAAYWQVGLLLIGGFALLYFSLSSGLFLFFNWTLRKRWTEKVIEHPLFPHQIRFEILHSLQSIVIFGLYGLLIVFSYRHQWVSIAFDRDFSVISDLAILAIWNEFHFYAGHQLMHTKLFLPIHRVHHKSIVVTPFSTYSFHPLESLIFGTVMIIPMFFIEFELMALVIFPIYHLFFNALGHSNVRLKRKTGGLKEFEISSHHNRHHTSFNVNFGFVSIFIDRLFHTLAKKKITKK